MWFVKVIFLGAPRLGKTTARRRWSGYITDISTAGEEEQPSTGVVESAPRIFIRGLSRNAALVTPTDWIAANDIIDEARLFLNLFHSHTKKASDQITPTTSYKKSNLINGSPRTDGHVFSLESKEASMHSQVEPSSINVRPSPHSFQMTHSSANITRKWTCYQHSLLIQLSIFCSVS